MARKRLKRPRDPIALAKLVGDIATGQVEDSGTNAPDPEMAVRGRKGGKLGGRNRAINLTPEQRAEIARVAAQTRWKKSK